MIGNAYFNRGSCLSKVNNYAPAVKDMAKAVQLEPTNALYFRVLGNTKYQLNELEGNPCDDWQKAMDLGDKKAAYSIKRFCKDNWFDKNINGATVNLMETFVERDRRPKSGIGRKDFLNKHLIMFLSAALVLLLLVASVFGLPTCLAGRQASDHIYYFQLTCLPQAGSW
jgi:tetratricopeptide (TPR) repeat protein